MALTVVIGPMFSGKSSELIARTEPFRIARKRVQYVKPALDKRNDGVESRIGARADAMTVVFLHDVPEADVYAVDEFHMFGPKNTEVVQRWLDEGAEVIIATLDTTYDGTVFPVIVNLYGLKPDNIVIKKAVCHQCLSYDAKYTQILDRDGTPLTKDLPEDLSEDGRYKYEARCRKCFSRG